MLALPRRKARGPVDVMPTNDDCFDKRESATTEELPEIGPELIRERLEAIAIKCFL